MSSKKGALIGGTLAFLFYIFLSSITPLDGKSVFPTANVVSDAEAMKEYSHNLPTSMIIFISLEVIGMLLGAIGYKIISDAPKQRA
jgi:hypothetical protein